MKKLLPYLNKYKVYAILTPILMILEVITDIMLPFLMAKIVDVGIHNQDTDYIIKVGLLMIGLAMLGMTFGVLSAFCAARAGHGFAAELRLETFKKIQSFSFGNLDKFAVSSLITRLTNDITTLGQVTVMSLRMGVRAPSMFIFALIMAISVNAKLTMVFVVSIPLTIILMGMVFKKAGPIFTRIQGQVDRLNAVIKENLTAIGVVKSFNREDFEEERFAVANDSLRDTALSAVNIIAFFMPIINIVIYGTIIAVLWFGGQQVVSGTLGSGSLISFVTYITQIMISLMMLSMFSMQLLRGNASRKRVLEVWDTFSEIEDPKNPITHLEDGSIVFKDVSFKYPSTGANVLTHINLNIKSGETIGIIGSTGSSKSTLVQLIPRLYDVTEGEVIVGKHNVKDYSVEALRDQVAFVLQKNTLFKGTIAENMRWGNKYATDEQIIKALKQASAWEFVSKFDDQLEHEVEENGDNYSGGQKQRLSIARALLKDPKIIILDDSTSAVDMSTDAKIQKMFAEELTDVTTIIIGQRISSIQNADRILVVHEGAIESIGSHEELLTTSHIYQEINESQAKGVGQHE